MRYFQLPAKEKQAGRDWAGFDKVGEPLQTLGRRIRAGSASADFEGGQAIPNPREEKNRAGSASADFEGGSFQTLEKKKSG